MEKNSISLMIGAAISSTFSTTVGRVETKVAKLGDAIRSNLRQEKAATDVTARKDALSALEAKLDAAQKRLSTASGGLNAGPPTKQMAQEIGKASKEYDRLYASVEKAKGALQKAEGNHRQAAEEADRQARSLGRLGQQNLKAEVHDDVNNIPVPHLDQMGESDLALLTRLADQNDLSLKIDAERIAVRPHASKLIAYGKGAVSSIHLRGREISRYQWQGTSRTKYGAVKASYYDQDIAARVPVTVGDPDAGPTLELRHDAYDAEEAARIASARVEQLARGTGSLKLTMPGRPGLRAGMVALVSGLRDGLNGTWVIERAEHMLDTKGYVTTATCVPPGKSEDGKTNSIQDWFGYLEEEE